jgi:hypothetical protein
MRISRLSAGVFKVETLIIPYIQATQRRARQEAYWLLR